MHTVSYDSLAINAGILLDLPQREGVGTILHDVSKGHRNVTLVHAPVWTPANKVMSLVYDGVFDYANASNASTLDMDFTSGDYSIGIWINSLNIASTGSIIGRYELNVGGWELYITDIFTDVLVTLRHHHSLTEVAGIHRSACYSGGWALSTWQMIGVNRVGGGTAQHYRNGVPLTMVDGGIIDPETTAQGLVIGVRNGNNGSFYKGAIWRPRVWNRVLTPAEWLRLYNLEVGLLP